MGMSESVCVCVCARAHEQCVSVCCCVHTHVWKGKGCVVVKVTTDSLSEDSAVQGPHAYRNARLFPSS